MPALFRSQPPKPHERRRGGGGGGERDDCKSESGCPCVVGGEAGLLTHRCWQPVQPRPGQGRELGRLQEQEQEQEQERGRGPGPALPLTAHVLYPK